MVGWSLAGLISCFLSLPLSASLSLPLSPLSLLPGFCFPWDICLTLIFRNFHFKNLWTTQNLTGGWIHISGRPELFRFTLTPYIYFLKGEFLKQLWCPNGREVKYENLVSNKLISESKGHRTKITVVKLSSISASLWRRINAWKLCCFCLLRKFDPFQLVWHQIFIFFSFC